MCVDDGSECGWGFGEGKLVEGINRLIDMRILPISIGNQSHGAIWKKIARFSTEVAKCMATI